ncbi:AAA family ATPase [Shewanella indica]|uniref:AAA family ATPase n=1 Tax=Shewanella indica TaxID=768528 RepID=UPI00399BCB35
MIDNVGNYSRATAGQIRFSDVNVIYGENRNGKSTLCDIFYSLSLNEPQLILDRKSIIRNQDNTQIQQLVELKFDGQRQAVRFVNSAWDSQPPEDSKLYIFDHSFIHRNVMTGFTYNRDNSTNMSGFILGENAAQFEALEVRNQKLRIDRRKLIDYKAQLEGHELGDFNSFIASPKPNKTLEELDASIQVSKTAQQTLATQIANVNQVIRRSNLEKISNLNSIDEKVQRINDCLSMSMENVHEASKAIVTNHKTHTVNNDSFDGWAAKGLTHLNEDCPFCGQAISDDAQHLIESYKTAFDDSFQRFVAATKVSIVQLQRETILNISLETLTQRHERNLSVLESYPEEAIKAQLDERAFPTQLNDKFEDVRLNLQELEPSLAESTTVIRASLTEKYDAPYNPISPIDFSVLQSKLQNFNNSVCEYEAIVTAINEILINFKEAQDVTELLNSIRKEEQNEVTITKERKRLHLDAECTRYIDLKNQIAVDQTQYETDKTTLEGAQEAFLDTYFTEINTLFRAIGSSDFNIARRINRGGVRTVYDLQVTFKDQLIDNSKLHCLFSESDKRALALCIFLAKIHQLSDEDKRKAILVMDDPVTSFDNERISSILRILFGLEPSIKQMIITTHYKGMASAVMKKFNDAQALKIIQTAQGSCFCLTTKAELTATAHDERYMEIMDFVNRNTQDNKITKLRPFIEDEMRQRYRLPLASLNLTESDTFNDCIEALKDNGYIDNTVTRSLHDYRTTLNRPAHELELWTLEDSRSYANGMMNFIYNDL